MDYYQKKQLNRFMDKFSMPSKESCWEWDASKDSYGYGTFWYKGCSERAHRVSYMTFVGPIPDGMCVLHRCDNTSCVNPDHLLLGTQADNVHDMDSKQRRNTGARLKGGEIWLANRLRHANITISMIAKMFRVSRRTIRRLTDVQRITQTIFMEN
mgnify:CR=1 FL=1|jgi:hypothetical protein